MKVDVNKNQKALTCREGNLLVSAILACDNQADLEAFLADLLTEAEILEFSNRFKAACLLSIGEKYNDVEAQTGMSTATIARISSWLKQGAKGYTKALENLHNRHNSPSTTSS